MGFRFALCFCSYCHPLLLKITLVSYTTSTLPVVSGVLYLVTIFWSMCRNLWVEEFGHQWSKNTIQSMPLSTCRIRKVWTEMLYLPTIPFFLYRVLYFKCSTWYAKAFCMIPKKSFFTQVARGNKESKESWWIPLSQSLLGGWIWFSLLLTWYIFWMSNFGAYIGLFFFATG